MNNEKVRYCDTWIFQKAMNKQTKINDYIVFIEHSTWVPTVMKKTNPGVL